MEETDGIKLRDAHEVPTSEEQDPPKIAGTNALITLIYPPGN